MRKGLRLFISLLMLAAFILTPVRASAAQDLKVMINGEIITAEDPVILENGRTLVPMKDFSTKLNAEVTFDEKQNKVLIEDKYTTVELILGDKNALVHKKYDFSGIPLKVTLDVPAKLVNGIVYVPLRFVAESLGFVVNWDAKNAMAIVESESDIIQVETPADYIIVHESDIQDIPDLAGWYEENYQKKGIYSFKTEKDTYVLVSAGVRPTGGYSFEIESATMVQPGSLYLTAKVNKPDADDFVTMALTYPNLLLKLENQLIDIVDGEIQE